MATQPPAADRERLLAAISREELALAGPVRFSVEAKSHAARRPFAHHLVVRETAFAPPLAASDPSIQDLYAALAGDERRNRLILDDVIAALEARRSPIVLTERKDHLEHLAERLRPFTRHIVVLQGGMGAKQRREVAQRLAAIPSAARHTLPRAARCVEGDAHPVRGAAAPPAAREGSGPDLRLCRPRGASQLMQARRRRRSHRFGMQTLQIFALISWISLPTVMFGGYSLLGALGGKLTPEQRGLFRAGHAHAGVLLVLSLVYYVYMGGAALPPAVKVAACASLAVGIIMQSGGFFWHAFLDGGGARHAGLRVTRVGPCSSRRRSSC